MQKFLEEKLCNSHGIGPKALIRQQVRQDKGCGMPVGKVGRAMVWGAATDSDVTRMNRTGKTAVPVDKLNRRERRESAVEGQCSTWNVLRATSARKEAVAEVFVQGSEHQVAECLCSRKVTGLRPFSGRLTPGSTDHYMQ